MSLRSLADRVLARALPSGSRGTAILSELREERNLRAGRSGRGAADRWYLRQAISVWLFATRDAAVGRSWSAGPAGRGEGPISRGLRQIRLSTRSLMRSPGYAVPALVIIAIGMTAATTIFTVVDAIVFRPLSLPDSERLVIVCEDHARLAGACIASPGNVEDFRRGASTLSELGIGRGWPFSLSDLEGTRGVRGGLATAGFLRALQVQPAVGRLFRDDEHGPDRDGVVLLGHGFWTTRYGADPEVVGSTVRLDGEPYTVIGVLPPELDIPLGLDGIEVWKPPHFDPLDPDVRGWRGFRAIGRLGDGTSLAAAEAEITTLYAAIAGTHPEVDEEWRVRVDPLLDVVVGDSRPVLLAFLGAAGLLLVIVCANVANLLLARGMDRRRELALRAALGAERGRLVSDLLVESLVVTGLATLLALALTSGTTRLLLGLAPPEIPRLDEVAVDGRVMAFAVLLSVATTLAFALLPAMRVTRWNLGETLKSGGRDGGAAPTSRLRSGLVVMELALSLVLLTSAGLLTRTLTGYLRWEPGFDRSRLLAVSAFVDVGKYPSRAAVTEFWRTAEDAVGQVPAIEAVATASAGPLFGGGDGATSFRMLDTETPDVLPSAWWHDVGPGYFATLGLPVVRGREITEDDDASSPPVAVVNEALVRASGLEEDILGRVVALPELELELQVIGVVSDVPPMTPGAPPRPEIYWSNRQLGRPATFFLVRTRSDPADAAREVTGALLGADPDLSVGTPQPLGRAEERALIRPRFQALVLVTFALAALVLSAVGVYAVVSYAVGRRIREIGIRIALGADASSVLGLLLRSALVVASAGVAVGLLASVAVGRLLRGMIHGVSPADPWSVGASALLLLGTATVATLAPARRAIRSDPLGSLRSD